MDHNCLQEIENLKQRAIHSDDVDAQIALARKYALGLTVEKDLNEAGYWYYLAHRMRHISSDNIFAEEPERDKAWRELSSIRHLVESEPLIIHGDTLIRCHSKEKSITIPAGIKIISHHAFHWKHDVEDVILPAGVVEIQDHAFSDKVRRITIPYGVKKLGRGAFSSETIEELILPEGISEIPSCAFGFGLRSITIPNSVTKIGNEAFNQCSKLRTINYQGSKDQWKAIEIGKYNTILRFVKKNYNFSYHGLIGQRVIDNISPLAERRAPVEVISPPKSTAVPSTHNHSDIIDEGKPVVAPPCKTEPTQVQPAAPSVEQTLKACLKCGKTLLGATCINCGYDHTSEIILLNKIDPRELQLSKK